MTQATGPIFPLQSIRTADLARALAERSGVSEDVAAGFLWTNLRNGGVTIEGDADRATFTAIEAYRFLTFVLSGSRFDPNQSPSATALARYQRLAAPTAQLFRERFFGNADLRFGNARQLETAAPFPITFVENIHDGDTWRLHVQFPHTTQPFTTSVRFPAFDAPEVSGQKLDRQLQGLSSRYAGSGGAVRGGTERSQWEKALRLGMQYQGELAGLVWRDAAQWMQARGGRFELAAGYVYNQGSGEACTMYNMVDNYGRWIGTPQVTDARLLSQYMRERLPQLMATDGAALRARFAQQVAQDTKLATALQMWRTRGPQGVAAAALVDPALWSEPRRLFSPERMAERAASWEQQLRTTTADPEQAHYGRDLVAMAIHLGIGYHYVKYRSQRSPFYERLEKGAKAAQIGLWNTPLFTQLEYTQDPGACIP
ncbi:MAG: hypothetical protein HY696_04840 [Deltaproteobacteria bacterium]|nr:hypothetical protein [Deltaproteobacteria bacterium]